MLGFPACSRHVAAAALLLATAAPALVSAQDKCFAKVAKVDCVNCGFEDVGKAWPRGSYNYDTPPGWACKSDVKAGDVKSAYASYDRCVWIKNGASPWGSLQSGEGKAFYTLHGRVSASKSVSGLQAGKAYELNLRMAERHGYGGDERVSITANGVVIAVGVNPTTAFAVYTFKFKASSSGTVDLKISNTSPHTDPKDGHTIYIDAIQIGAAFDCGEGATCYDFLGSGSGGFVCRCDVNGWLGQDSKGKKAACVSAASLSTAAALAKDVEGLKETSKSTTSTLKALAEKSTALVRSANDASSRIENLAAYDALVQESNATMAAALGKVAGDLADVTSAQSKLQATQQELADSVAGVVKRLDALVAALQAGAATVPDVTEPANLATSFVPQIVSEDGGIDLAVERGRHATVNGKMLLTVDEIKAMIAGAVKDALATAGDAAQ